MSINKPYRDIADLPPVVPIFPLAGALLLPRGLLPLNIFEPRYLAMVDDALKSARVIGMIQPRAGSAQAASPPLEQVGCLGRITQFAETGDGRYALNLTGVLRFRVRLEPSAMTPYRQAQVDYEPFAADLHENEEADIDREGVLRALMAFAQKHGMSVDRSGVEQAPNEALVNALSMMSPFGPREKQALLEAETIKARAEALIAITEFELARTSGAPPRAAMSGQGDAPSSGDPPPALRIDPRLLEILVCPLTKTTLEYDGARQELVSRAARLAFPIRDGIPIMIPEEARTLDPHEADTS